MNCALCVCRVFPNGSMIFFLRRFIYICIKKKLRKWLLASFIGFVLPLFRLRLRTPKNNPSICSASSKHAAHIQIGACVYKVDFLEGIHSVLIGLRKDQRRFQSTQLHKKEMGNFTVSLTDKNHFSQ